MSLSPRLNLVSLGMSRRKFAILQGGTHVVPQNFTPQALMDAAELATQQSGTVFCLPGTYEIDQTIDISRTYGVRFVAPAAFRTDGWNNDSTVRFKWTGAAGGTMFRMNILGCQFENIIFDANDIAGVKGTVLYSEPGWGCGYNEFNRCRWTGFKRQNNGESAPADTVQLQFGLGDSSGEINCADNLFNHCMFDGGLVAIRSTTHQAVNNRFIKPDFITLNKVFDNVFGGGVLVVGGSVINCDMILEVGFGGLNLAANSFYDLKIEPWALSQRFTRWLKSTSNNDMNQVRFINCHDGNAVPSAGNTDNDASHFEIANKTHLFTQGCTYRTSGWPLKKGAGMWFSDYDIFEDDVITNADLGGGRGNLIAGGAGTWNLNHPWKVNIEQGPWE